MSAPITVVGSGLGPPDPHDSAVRSKIWLGTSWKMTRTIAEARAFVEDLVRLSNAAARLKLGEIDGLFVERAAWTPDGVAASPRISSKAVTARAAGAAQPRPRALPSMSTPLDVFPTREQRSR